MSILCPCRTTTLRIFVRSITQVQLSEDKFARSAWHAHRRLHPRSCIIPAAGLQCRQLHSTTPPLRKPAHDDRVVSIVPSQNVYGRRRPEEEEPIPKSTPIAELSLGVEQVAAGVEYEKSQNNEGLVNEWNEKYVVRKPSVRGSRPKSRNNESGHQGTQETPAPRYERQNDHNKQGSYRRQNDHNKQGSYRRQDRRERPPPEPREDWQIQKDALKKKFPEGWKPRKRLSPDALTGIRALHQQFPDDYTTEVLANKFEVSVEAIRRILKSKWEPSAHEEEKRNERWFKRGMTIWTHWAELGKKPPRQWRDEGIDRKPWVWQDYDEDAVVADVEEDGEGAEMAARIKTQKRLSKNLM